MGLVSLSDFLCLGQQHGDVTVEFDEDIQVELTSLQRVYFPAERMTKYDVLRYYVRMWVHIEPYLRGRPAILQRYPRGIDGPRFFQHDLAAPPAYVRTEIITNSAGREISYAVYDSLPALLYLVNQGNIEQHPWFSRVGDLDRPDWLALDLDPGQAPWQGVVEVALLAREVFAGRGLTAYPKTSGSKGIHLYVPLQGATYAEAARFCREVAAEIAERAPELATLEHAIERRGARVYLDHQVNARGKSLAAPYTLRARAGATVSMPLSFQDLSQGARIEDFTLRSAPDRAGRLARGWAGFFQKRQRLP